MSEEIENRDYKVYMHVLSKDITNLEHDKRYIGATRKSLDARWNHGRGYMQQKCFWEAIQRYGWDNIEHKLVADNLTAKEAGELEQSLIMEYKTNIKDYGFNMSSGGETLLPKGSTKLNDELKKIRSRTSKEMWLAPGFREAHSGNNCHFHNDKFVFSGKDNACSKEVILLNTLEVFESRGLAAKKYGLVKHDIIRCCNHKTKYGGNNSELGNLVWMDYNEYLNSSEEVIQERLLYGLMAKRTGSHPVIDINDKKIYSDSVICSKRYGYAPHTMSHLVLKNNYNNTIYRLDEYCKSNNTSLVKLINNGFEFVY